MSSEQDGRGKGDGDNEENDRRVDERDKASVLHDGTGDFGRQEAAERPQDEAGLESKMSNCFMNIMSVCTHSILCRVHRCVYFETGELQSVPHGPSRGQI